MIEFLVVFVDSLVQRSVTEIYTISYFLQHAIDISHPEGKKKKKHVK